MLSLSLILVCSALATIYYILVRPLQLYLQDPLRLRKYPAPNIFAASTSLWLLKATWSQRRSKVIHEQIGRLGDVIRVSPNHLVFNDPAAIKDIYGVLAISHGVAKDDFYDRAAGDAHDLVQLRDRQEHSDRRKALANAFAAKTVVNMEPIIRNTLALLLQRLDSHCDESSSTAHQSVNLRLWLNFFTLDVIGDMGFGIPMNFLQQMSDSIDSESTDGMRHQVPGMIDALHRGVRYSLTLANIPSIRFKRQLHAAINMLRPLAHKLGSTGATDFENICVRKLRQRMRQGPAARSSADFMSFVLDEKNAPADIEANQEIHGKFQSLIADSVMMMNAGSDTTAAALTSTIWFLLRNPAALARLKEEISAAAPQGVCCDSAEIFAYDAVKDLLYLRACIDESLRLRPPIAYQLPRLVSRPVKIAGHDILPGTVVAVAPWSVHRHPRLYRDPDEYRPERWLDYDAEYPQQREHLKQYNIVFSQGSRACIGRHLAIVELQILIPTLISRYRMSLADPEADLEIFERFNSNPGPMHIKLERRTMES